MFWFMTTCGISSIFFFTGKFSNLSWTPMDTRISIWPKSQTQTILETFFFSPIEMGQLRRKAVLPEILCHFLKKHYAKNCRSLVNLGWVLKRTNIWIKLPAWSTKPNTYGLPWQGTFSKQSSYGLSQSLLKSKI